MINLLSFYRVILKMNFKNRILLISTPFFEVPPKEYGGIERIVTLAFDYYSEIGYIVDIVSKPGSAYHTFTHDEVFQLDFSTYKYIIVYTYDQKLIEYLDNLSLRNIFIVVQNNYSARLNYLEKLKNCNICMISDAQAKFFQSYINISSKIFPNSIDTKKYTNLNSTRSKDIIYIGALGQHKSPLSCLEFAVKNNLNIDFYGPKIFRENEKEYAERFQDLLKTYPKAKLMGECSESEKNTLLNTYKYFIFLPGVDLENWCEPFGIAPLEAMACGCTVITQFENGGHIGFCTRNNSISYDDIPHILDPEAVRDSIMHLDYRKVFRDYYPQ